MLQHIAEHHHIELLFPKGLRKINLFYIANDDAFAELLCHLRRCRIVFDGCNLTSASTQNLRDIPCRRPNLQDPLVATSQQDQLGMRGILGREVNLTLVSTRIIAHHCPTPLLIWQLLLPIIAAVPPAGEGNRSYRFLSTPLAPYGYPPLPLDVPVYGIAGREAPVASLVRAPQVVYRRRMRPAHELFARPGRSRCP